MFSLSKYLYNSRDVHKHLLTTEPSLTTTAEALQMSGLVNGLVHEKNFTWNYQDFSHPLSFSLGVYALFTITLQKSDQETVRLTQGWQLLHLEPFWLQWKSKKIITKSLALMIDSQTAKISIRKNLKRYACTVAFTFGIGRPEKKNWDVHWLGVTCKVVCGIKYLWLNAKIVTI